MGMRGAAPRTETIAVPVVASIGAPDARCRCTALAEPHQARALNWTAGVKGMPPRASIRWPHG